MSAAPATRLTLWQWLALIVGGALLWWLAIGQTTGSLIAKDAGDNLHMALNLAHHGVISVDKSAPYRPSMMREPVPVAVMAGAVRIVDSILGEEQPEAYFSGATARYLKFSNLLWLTLLAGCTFIAIRLFTATFWLALAGAALVALHFSLFVPLEIRQLVGIDNLCTELAGAAMLSAASLLLAVSVARRNALAMAAAGLCFGLTALTKASFFYVCLGALGASAVWYAIIVMRKRATAPRQTMVMAGAFMISFLLVTGSWLYRNRVQTGHFQIAERSGSTLLHRAFLDDVTPSEFVGGFAVWGDPRASRLVSRLTGYSRADLAAGGRLQRLSEQFSGPAEERELSAEESGRPDEAVSFYRRARATYEAKLAQFTQAGDSYPSGAADVATRNEAIGLIVQHPLKHAVLMTLLMWRGATWTFPVLVIAFLYAGWRGRPDLLLFVLPAIGYAVFYSAASQFVPRYGYVIYPITVIALLTMLAAVRLPSRRAAPVAA
jgi:hypothetical protein